MSGKKGFQRQRSDNDYFRMGAAIAVGELYDMAAFGTFLEDESAVRAYLGSFGVRGLDDVDALGIKGPYRRDFERLYLGKPIEDQLAATMRRGWFPHG